MTKTRSSCCNAPTKLNKENAERGQTVFYICTSCDKACDLATKPTLETAVELKELVCEEYYVNMNRVAGDKALDDLEALVRKEERERCVEIVTRMGWRNPKHETIKALRTT